VPAAVSEVPTRYGIRARQAFVLRALRVESVTSARTTTSGRRWSIWAASCSVSARPTLRFSSSTPTVARCPATADGAPGRYGSRRKLWAASPTASGTTTSRRRVDASPTTTATSHRIQPYGAKEADIARNW
jgi:hypothetical protein